MINVGRVFAQESDEDEDDQPFAKLFARMSVGCAAKESSNAPTPRPAVTSKPKPKPRAGRHSDARSEKAREEEDEGVGPSDDEVPLVRPGNQNKEQPPPKRQRGPKAAVGKTPAAEKIDKSLHPKNLGANFDAAAGEGGATGEINVHDGDDMTPEDHEVLKRFEPFIADQKEMNPRCDDEASFSQWVKDLFDSCQPF